MQHYLAVLTFLILISMVFYRTITLKKLGIDAMQFGKLDKSDFLLPPLFLFYFYLVIASAFDLPTIAGTLLFNSGLIAWVGVLFCFLGIAFFAWSVITFGKSFRVGIDVETPGKLITTGAFAVSRNPIYVAFALVLAGQFLIQPNIVLLIYLCAGYWLFNRQVLREEDFLVSHYGNEYQNYCYKVKRYL